MKRGHKGARLSRFSNNRFRQSSRSAEPLERRDLLSLLGIAPDYPVITYDSTGVINYDANTQDFSLEATPLRFRENGASPLRLISGTRQFSIAIQVDNSGNLVGGAPGDDLVVAGDIDIDGDATIDVTGTLLTGEISQFGYQEAGATDLYDFRFTVTGGALASYFVGKDIGITTSSENSTFADDFSVNFTGGAKGTLGSIEKLVGSLSGTKYNDLTGDGLSVDDTPLANVNVNLYQDVDNDGQLTGADGAPIDTTTTNGSGFYSFTDLTPGNYLVAEEVPLGYAQTAPSTNGGVYAATVTAGAETTGLDFANVELSSLGGTKFLDVTGDGLTPDDTPLGGVTINLYQDIDHDGQFTSADEPAVASTTTAAGTGTYSFDDLLPGVYFVQEVVPAGYYRTFPTATSVYGVIVTPGSQITDLDYANAIKYGSISGVKFKDSTGNGQTPDDLPLGGTTIKLYRDVNNDGQLTSADGSPIASTSSAAGTGAYSFTDLVDGRYFVKEVVPNGYIRTGPTLTDTYTVVIADGSDVADRDFCNFELTQCDCGCGCNTIYNVSYKVNGTSTYTDLRGHTNQGDLVEVTFTVGAGQSVELTLVSYYAPGPSFVASDAYLQTIFDVDTGVFGPGTYTLSVFNPNSKYQVDFVCGEAIHQFGPENSNIFYTPQQRLISADNDGNTPVLPNGSTLAGNVYIDANNNGEFDATESGIHYAKVKLTGGSVNLTVYTKADGSYVFTNLPAGNYTITEIQPSGYTDGTDAAGSEGGTVGNDVISGISLGPSTAATDYIFGELVTSGGSDCGSGDSGAGSSSSPSVASVQQDPLDPSHNMLVVNGTSGDDVIRVKRSSNGRYDVTVNGHSAGSFKATENGRSLARIVVYGGDGNDNIKVETSVKLQTELYGGDGNDRLQGGAGGNILVGGAGNDTMIGGKLRDLIIGDTGSDTINGWESDDIIVSGGTIYDSNRAALMAIFAEWNSSRDYKTRREEHRGWLRKQQPPQWRLLPQR